VQIGASSGVAVALIGGADSVAVTDGAAVSVGAVVKAGVLTSGCESETISKLQAEMIKLEQMMVINILFMLVSPAIFDQQTDRLQNRGSHIIQVLAPVSPLHKVRCFLKRNSPAKK
jgi:hypothetical protein